MCHLRRLFCVVFVLVVAEFAVGDFNLRIPKAGKPQVYRKIELNAPQMFVDDYLVENRYDKNLRSSTVPHVLHKPYRLPKPIMVKDKPWESEWGVYTPTVVYDPDVKLFRMYYTSEVKKEQLGKKGYPATSRFICYAESKDGIGWTKPELDLISFGEYKRTNIILDGKLEMRQAQVVINRTDKPNGSKPLPRSLLTLPSECFKGNRFLMIQGDWGPYLATSNDGIGWKSYQQQLIPYRSDCHYTFVYDPQQKLFSTFFRPARLFDHKPKHLKGTKRMLARLTSDKLWMLWNDIPSTVIIPDEDDGKRFYGMPTFYYGGVYWGFLQQYTDDPAAIDIELMTSRDGIDWRPVPGRKKILPLGENSWECGMVFAHSQVIENGDEWWVYYGGNNGYHNIERTSAIGLAKFRKEGFVSIRAKENESYIVTRPIIWPGGELVINADVHSRGGFVRVRVTEDDRTTVFDGFGFDDCITFKGDSVRHRIQWKKAKMSDLKGEMLRLEFEFKNADIYAFLAAE